MHFLFLQKSGKKHKICITYVKYVYVITDLLHGPLKNRPPRLTMFVKVERKFDTLIDIILLFRPNFFGFWLF